ncbi:hypothetical protein E2C01_026809 [Portunus trituberculatus]|uniref:Uncharacterized protein n=1 Tax=Portunus trituberculatus TaxID=210409 RepID=A0A5B7EJZ3_PORTR|nr:hypothetical protein [Portunus trituberculatus]
MFIFGTEIITGSWSSAGHLALVPLLLLPCLAALQHNDVLQPLLHLFHTAQALTVRINQGVQLLLVNLRDRPIQYDADWLLILCPADSVKGLATLKRPFSIVKHKKDVIIFTDH